MVATGRTVTITLPLPEAALSPNVRVDWRVRMRASGAARRDAHWAACQTSAWVTPFAGRARIDAAFSRCAAEPLAVQGRVCPTDPDNAWATLKSVLDGIRDAGLLRGDTSAEVQLGAVTIIRCTHGRGTPPHAWRSGVVLVLTESAQ